MRIILNNYQEGNYLGQFCNSIQKKTQAKYYCNYLLLMRQYIVDGVTINLHKTIFFTFFTFLYLLTIFDDF